MIVTGLGLPPCSLCCLRCKGLKVPFSPRSRAAGHLSARLQRQPVQVRLLPDGDRSRERSLNPTRLVHGPCLGRGRQHPLAPGSSGAGK